MGDSGRLVKSKNAIYITGLPTTVGQNQIEDMCKSVGRIRKIKVYRDAGGIPKGDATVVFENRSKTRDVAAEAVAELDGKEIDQGGLGAYVVRVQEAEFREQESRPAAVPASTEPHKVVPAPTRYAPDDAPAVLLKNLVDAAAPPSASERVALEEEVGVECLKYGRCLDAEYRADDASLLVSFASHAAARRCAISMNGRSFCNRVIRADLWPDGRRGPPADSNATAPSSVATGPQQQPAPAPASSSDVDPPPAKRRAAGDYVGAPPPRTVEPPPAYVEPDPSGPTARTRLRPPEKQETQLPDPLRGLAGFIRGSTANSSSTDARPSPSTGPTSQPEPRQPAALSSALNPKKKRSAADFFDDDI